MSRPEKPVDWNKVDQYLIGGMTGVEIAAFFDLNPETFYDKVKEKYKVGFTEYCRSKRSKGDGLLKVKSFEKAMNGDNTQLTLNLKNRCGWTDKVHQTFSNDEENPVPTWIQSITGKSEDLVKNDKQSS